MLSRVRTLQALFLFAGILVAGAWPIAVHAAGAGSGKLLSSVAVAERNACAVIRIEFNSRVQYLNHLPQSSGDELRIRVKPIGEAQAGSDIVVDQESLRAPANERASLHAIELGLDGADAALTLYFKHNVAFKVAPGADFKSILIAVPGAEPSAPCIPVFEDAQIADGASATGVLEPSQGGAGEHRDGIRMTAAEIEAVMMEARSALSKGDADRALDLLKKAGQAGDARFAQEARELIGIAYEKKGLIVDASASFREYLTLYPKGPAADRVRARLAEIDKSGLAVLEQLKKSQADASAKIPPPIGDGKSDSKRLASAAEPSLAPAQEPKDPAAWTVTQNGSFATYYNRNQGGRDFFIPPRLQLGWDKDSVYQVYQNSILGTADYEARFDNAYFTGRFHVTSSQENRYIAGQSDETNVSELYFDGKDKENGVSGRIGRQSYFGGGVLGRFDGLFASVQANDNVRYNAVTGSPVERSSDTPFFYDSYFYGISADVEHWYTGVDTSLYFIDQRTGGMIDRQGVGTELRYFDEMLSGFAAIDYDIHYFELNYASLTGTCIFPGFSTIGVNFDYRRAPLIFTSNALQGQSAATLSELLKIYTHDDIENFALDRSARSFSGGGNFSQPLNEHLLLSGDATVTYMSSSKASGGVGAMPSPGTEYYTSLQLTNTDVFTNGDQYAGGVRFADTQSAYRYMIEGSIRYPVTKDWRVGPVLRAGYVDIKSDGHAEYDIMPSIRTSYYSSEDVVLEFEVGKKWTERETDHGIARETELTVLSGVRYDFHTGN